ncbi:MnhB domain-containing protein [Serpentinicella alkaliphila]|uniref:Multisubunit sodium/proton antiporter MrpB subunit n=1 Tax=Serpentinicella alkaliphila TaxID=1734049 RepID=A0A4R2TUE2_9FIRM|nr:MnhB domain-containing protein [Serpentinicella alkaliphila]QUH25653.1 sodium:proton antiporter [Serpentinicella alkaliphila]TCQ06636.1 multisubunit sodium/proton antiporter MrpB subunit [Serpentinicella alkaliphila]
MDDIIVRIISRFVIPYIYLYGIYVVIHGSISPGGGFAGGAIIGSAFVLYTLVFGLKRAQLKIPYKFFKRRIEGLMCFIFMAFIVVFMGYDVQKIRELGAYALSVGESVKPELLSTVTIGIGMMVAVTLISLFHIFIKEDKFSGNSTGDSGQN